MAWTEERIERLKDLWAEGYSASRIASMLGRDITRSAVCGKVHRLGLSDRKTKMSLRLAANSDRTVVSCSPRNRRPRLFFGKPRPELKVISNPSPPPDPAIWKAEPGREPVPFMEVKAGMCRWPLGDPLSEDFGFCGCPKVPGKSFCANHVKLAFRKEERRSK